MKQIIAMIVLMFNVSAFAQECTPEGRKEFIIKAATVGVVGGVAVGAIMIATTPVGAVGGPMVITWAMGPTASASAISAVVVKSVIPVAALTGLTTGTIFGAVAWSGMDEACLKQTKKSLNSQALRLEQDIKDGVGRVISKIESKI